MEDSGTEPSHMGLGAEDGQVGLLSATPQTPLQEAADPEEARWPSPRTRRRVLVWPSPVRELSGPRPRCCRQHLVCPLPLRLFPQLTAKCPPLGA